jgi:hypothetical protein
MNEYKLAWVLLQARANDKTKALMAECLQIASDESLISEIESISKEGEK